jgi:hypothetical protein
MTATTNFNDLRLFTEITAFQYYGSASPKYHAVSNAWYAVGLENNPAFGGLPLNVFNKTESANKNYHYNTRIEVTNYKINPSVMVNMSSNDFIHLYSSTSNSNPDNIEIKFGSEFHAYIAPGCPGGSRMENPNYQNNVSDNNSKIISKESVSNIQTDFNVLPNPNNGKFKVILNNDNELPKSIIICDVLGREVLNVHASDQYEIDVNLKELGDGIYFVNIYFSDKTVSKRVIKN